MDTTQIEVLLDEILVDAYGEDEQLWSLQAAMHTSFALPMDAYVIGEAIPPGVTRDVQGMHAVRIAASPAYSSLG